MNTNIDKNKFIEPLARVAELPSDRIDQTQSEYSDDEPCSVGAHLANILYRQHHLNGFDEWIALAGGNRAHAIVILQEATGVKHPLFHVPWRVSVRKVCDYLERVDELPSLVGAELWKQNLVHIDMQNVDLTGANLWDSNISFSNLDGACLVAANMSYVDARYTSFNKTNLSGANLRFSHLPDAEFEEAMLIEADLYQAYLRGCNLRKANFSNAKMGNTTIHLSQMEGINLTGVKIKEMKMI